MFSPHSLFPTGIGLAGGAEMILEFAQTIRVMVSAVSGQVRTLGHFMKIMVFLK